MDSAGAMISSPRMKKRAMEVSGVKSVVWCSVV